MPRPNDPIFVLDSGLGGLTVARAILERLPGEQVIYFGDSARLPYGSKTKATVTSFVRQIINWGLDLNPKHVVIACNTASALAMADLRQEFAPLTISGVIDPGARAAAAAAGAKDGAVIGVIATEATIRSEAYPIAMRKRRHRVRMILRATPLLVPMIEEGRNNEDSLVDMALRQYLLPMAEHDLDVLVLGCTHYPLLKPAIQQVVGEKVLVIDSAERCAEDVALKLGGKRLLAPADGLDASDRLRAFVTDDPDRFARLSPRFLGFPIPRPTLIEPDLLYRLPAQSNAIRLPA